MANETDALWSISDLAKFLRRSPRWVFIQLARKPDEPGSIPHVRLRGKRGGVRFIPSEIGRWVSDGCAPVAEFRKFHHRRELR